MIKFLSVNYLQTPPPCAALFALPLFTRRPLGDETFGGAQRGLHSVCGCARACDASRKWLSLKFKIFHADPERNACLAAAVSVALPERLSISRENNK